MTMRPHNKLASPKKEKSPQRFDNISYRIRLRFRLELHLELELNIDLSLVFNVLLFDVPYFKLILTQRLLLTI